MEIEVETNTLYIWKKSNHYPGARASMDHSVSVQPGLIPQISGRLTSMRIQEGQ
jgi:hypothetical protein